MWENKLVFFLSSFWLTDQKNKILWHFPVLSTEKGMGWRGRVGPRIFLTKQMDMEES